MAAPKLTGGAIQKALMLTSLRTTQIPASQAGVMVCQWILPCWCSIYRIDYSLNVQGAVGATQSLKAQISASDISESVNPAAGAGVKTGSLNISNIGKQYAEGTLITLICTTGLNSTINDAVACLTVIPTMGL